MKIFRILVVAMVTFAMTACSDYLDIKPYGKVVPTTPEEFSALLNSHLDAIDRGTCDYLVPRFSHVSELDAEFSDNFETGLTASTGRPGAFDLLPYVGSKISNNGTEWYYRDHYEVIRNCNIVLHEMEERDTEEANKILALAYAMRGVAYYQLMRYFCEVPEAGNTDNQLGVPVVTEFDMEASPARSSLSATIAQIENDLKMALSLHMTDEVYRFTDDVNTGYLCRLYFWSQQWDKALSLAQELLRRHPLLSGEDYVEMMTTIGPLAGNQLIKAHRASSGNDQEVEGTLTSLASRPVSVRLLNYYRGNESVADVRYNLCFNEKRLAKNKIFCGMRAAEFALIEVECYYHLNRSDEALKSINRLRSNRISDYVDIEMNDIPDVPGSEIITTDVTGKALTPLLGLILGERRKELFLEGDRFFELKRNGSPEFVSYLDGFKYVTRSYMYTFPIPVREFDITDNLIQNPGYTEIVDR